MRWMLDIQLGRRNLPPAQRLAVMNKFKKKIQEQAKSTQGTRTDLTSSPNGEKVKSTHTDKELAKMAGVGTGTVARFNEVMNSDDEVLLDLLESNIRRRGEVGGSAKKVGKRIKELERLYGVYHGGHGSNQYMQSTNNSDSAKTQQEELADMIGVSVDTLNNYKKLTELIPEVQDKDI